MDYKRSSIYLAAPYGRREYLRTEIAPMLRAAGHHITSSWINDPPENDKIAAYLRSRKCGDGLPRNDAWDRVLAHEAKRDCLDVQNSDMLIRFPAEDTTTPSSGGKFVETGLAIAYGLKVVVIGNKECVFDYMNAVVHVFDNFKIAMACMGLGVADGLS